MKFDYESEELISQLDEAKTLVVHTFEKMKILSEAFAALNEGEYEFDPEEGAYGYVPIDVCDFLQSMIELDGILRNDADYRHSDLPYRPCAFVEVGCGTGRNVFLLKQAKDFPFQKIVGFDVAEEYVAHGERLYRLGNDLFVDDCMTFDYGGYDVVFFYRPFHNAEKQTAFEHRLIESMKRGAYVVGHMSESLDDSPLLMQMEDTSVIWKKL